MTVVEYASKETKAIQYGSSEVKEKCKIKKRKDDEFPEVHVAIAVTTFLSYYVLIIIGHIRDFLRKIKSFEPRKISSERRKCTYVANHKGRGSTVRPVHS